MKNTILTSQALLPDWNEAKNSIFPILSPYKTSKNKLMALKNQDILCMFVSSQVKMFLACFYNGKIIPLSQQLLAQWAITASAVHLAVEENMRRIAQNTRLKKCNNGWFDYYSVQAELPVFNAALLFYKPFQFALQQKFGESFCAVAPELTCGIVFDRKHAQLYAKAMRDDVHLTYECSSKSLSTELLEISSYGVVPLAD